MKEYVELIGLMAVLICIEKILEETQKMYKYNLKRRKLIDYLIDIIGGWKYLLIVVFTLCNVLIIITENEEKFKIVAVLFLITVIGWLYKNNVKSIKKQYIAFLIEIVAGMSWVAMLINSIYS